MLNQLNMSGLDKIEVAVKRLQMFEPPEGYYLAFSGGKDSVVIKGLADLAGVKYDAHYNITTVDPPELVQFIKEYHPDVALEKARYKDGMQVTMWNLIVKKKIPPTRIARYCCEYLKEGSGVGRFVVTGVRYAESARRKNSRSGLEIEEGGKRRTLTDPDNPDNEEMVRLCPMKGNHILNPIIDWGDEDVWEFIHGGATEYAMNKISAEHLRRILNLPYWHCEDGYIKLCYCCLYDQGYKRLGCIGCPMSSHQAAELERYPKYKQAYLRAFARMIEARRTAGKDLDDAGNWETPEKVMEWWIKGRSVKDTERQTESRGHLDQL